MSCRINEPTCKPKLIHLGLQRDTTFSNTVHVYYSKYILCYFILYITVPIVPHGRRQNSYTLFCSGSGYKKH